MRVISDDEGNLGILTLSEALKKAEEKNLDLIEISPNADPPIAKIMDYGRFLYEAKKKERQTKAKSSVSELKSIQIKPATGDHDLELKAKAISKFLHEGHRVRITLFLSGRAKYMEMQFLKDRMERVLRLITEEYRIGEGPVRSPKGLAVTVERGKAISPAPTPASVAPTPPPLSS